jgi:hypothetical protein
MEFSERGRGDSGDAVVNTGWGWRLERYWRGAMAMKGGGREPVLGIAIVICQAQVTASRQMQSVHR